MVHVGNRRHTTLARGKRRGRFAMLIRVASSNCERAKNARRCKSKQARRPPGHDRSAVAVSGPGMGAGLLGAAAISQAIVSRVMT